MVIDLVCTWLTRNQYDRPFRESRDKQLEIHATKAPSPSAYNIHVYTRLRFHYRLVIVASGPSMKIIDLNDKVMTFGSEVASCNARISEILDDYRN